MSISPDLISLAMLATALRPDEHCRLVVLMGTLRGCGVSEITLELDEKNAETHV